MTTAFSHLLRSAQDEAGVSRLQVPDDWMQGRSVFGGLQAALTVRARRTLVPADIPLRTLQTTFIAPVAAGAMQARAQVLRTGKSASHLEARLVDGDQTLATAIGVFGAARPSVVAVAPRQPTVPCDQPIEFPFMQGFTPNFTQHFSVQCCAANRPSPATP